MPDAIWIFSGEDLVYLCLFIAFAVAGGLAAYWLQRRHTMREIDAIAMQERHLYRALMEQMQATDRLRMVNHDAKNELFVLQGFLERGRNRPGAVLRDRADRPGPAGRLTDTGFAPDPSSFVWAVVFFWQACYGRMEGRTPFHLFSCQEELYHEAPCPFPAGCRAGSLAGRLRPARPQHR